MSHELAAEYLREVMKRLEQVSSDRRSIDEAIGLMTEAIENGGIVQAFGTGHSEAFAMEIAGRAGGLIPTNRIPLRDVVLRAGWDAGVLSGPELERDETVAEELLNVSTVEARDVFLIASNSGVNGAIVGMALEAKRRGHKVIAVTSVEHSNGVPPKHASGKRLSDVADVVIDNTAPYGDTTLLLGESVGLGAISSITGAFIAQLLTIGVAQRLAAAGKVPPVYLSDNIPGGGDHNRALEHAYSGRIRREA